MIQLPREVRGAVESALDNVQGTGERISSVYPVGGGCINPSARIETDRGGVYFLKWNDVAPPGMFEAEADGLASLGEAATGSLLRVPEVLGVGEAAGTSSWLLLEWVARGPGGGGWGERLGRALADLHRSGRGTAAGYGWRRDNFIGSLPQSNSASMNWAEFWRDRRLAPQLERARGAGLLGRDELGVLDRLLERVDPALRGADGDGPSLVHGDLWSGNVYPDADGRPVLVDPAVYRGHREVDLAMSELFGGFPTGYLQAYQSAWPLDAGYRRRRRPLYQLYYLLVHVNLFGAGYVGGTLRAAREVLNSL